MFAANSRASSAKLRSSHICKVRSKSSGHLSWLLIKSFGCGVGTAILLFALAAQIFAHTALSLELVKPATCASVAVGAVLSGLVLANGIAQKRLLCGVSVGVFYALCLSLTTALSGKPLVFDHVNLALLAALLFGGFRALSNVYFGFDFLMAMNIPGPIYNMMPYIISLVVLAFTSKKSRAPKAEGIPYDKGQR